jgi:hypothetical protein
MAAWIEVPAHRIYVISAHELRDGFDYIAENGRPATRGEIPYRFVRKKDGKVFKWTRFAPQCSVQQRRCQAFILHYCCSCLANSVSLLRSRAAAYAEYNRLMIE